MKKNLFLIIVIVIVGTVLFLGKRFSVKKNSMSPETVKFVLEGKKLNLYVADTESERQKGLMFYRSLDKADGMIFKFPDKNFQSFWNQNTFMDLDVYWLDNQKVVGKSFLPSIEKSKKVVIIYSPKAVNTVIELPSK